MQWNLDDQTYDEIMESVLGRLPWLSADWTDHNAHDPGITILELMAWYKEMQQYHLNLVTDRMREKLLKLVGVRPEKERAARCFIETPESCGDRRELSRLETAEGIPFEIPESLVDGAHIDSVFIEDESADGRVVDVTGVFEQPNISVTPFSHGAAETSLVIGFTNVRANRLKIWFNVQEERAVSRNPFVSWSPSPRKIEWSFEGLGEFEPVSDETYDLSVSGYVSFDVPEDWAETEIAGKKLRYIRLRLIDPGCEESVRANAVSVGWHEVIQQETWSSLRGFTVDKDAEITLTDALSYNGIVYAFLRTEEGLRQIELTEKPSDDGRCFAFDATEASRDGQDNVFIVSIDQMHIGNLIFPSTGLPDMEIELPLGGRTVLTDQFGLICDTPIDGVIRPALWRYTRDLGVCSPGDRVFTLDQAGERLVFGDGEHGAIVPRGEGAILLAPFVLSWCGEGNVPEGSLKFTDDGFSVSNTAASGGVAAQSISDAGRYLLSKMESSRQCASEQDYERAALATPGLRVAAAKAVAGLDLDEPSGVSRIPAVTVIVVPYNSGERPMPDARFLSVIQTHLDKMRPICTKVKVIAPRYVPVGFYTQVRASGQDIKNKLRDAAVSYLSLSRNREIGDTIVRNDLLAELMKIDGVYKIDRLELRQLGPDCYMTPGGDIQIPRNAVAYLANMDVDIR